MNSLRRDQSGVTLIELIIGMGVVALIILSMFGLFVTMVRSSIITKRQAVASTLATNQMEYLKSLPYDSLAIAGGSIYSTSPLPATSTQKVDGVTYKVTTSINYVDDAYDGCANTTIIIKMKVCRNYAGTTVIDTNPQDYKIAHVSVTDSAGLNLADVDTQVSARVSETASSSGAMFVTVLDETGSPVQGVTVQVLNSTVAPAVNLSDSSDSNGIAIFYGLPVDTNGFDYNITGSKSGYSTLTTIGSSGSLQPTYPNQKVLSQQSSYVSLTLKMQGTNSLIGEATDTSGNPINGLKVYVKGGYKKYTDSTNTQYCYDNMVTNGTTTVCSTSAGTTDNRPTTSADGTFTLSNLVPGDYIFCGDDGGTNCKIGSTTYYLAAAAPYSGLNPFNPVSIPIYNPLSPPTTTFDNGGVSYLQKVRLIFTTSSTFPRVQTLNPNDASQGHDTMSNFAFIVTGVNLPCSATAASCSTHVSFNQGANNYPAACTGTTGTKLNCTVNLSSASQGMTQMVVNVGSNTLTLPASPIIGGINVTP
jgi:type II secretory pathway pseudopilin PulG